MVLDTSSNDSALCVLAVEDDRSVAQAVAAVLNGADCTLTLAASVDEAFAIIARHPRAFDVVITDNHMPKTSGGELVRELRRTNFGGKIVVLSAYISPEEEVEYGNLGVDALLQKPFAVGELRRAIGLEVPALVTD